jgi:phage gpG-like protein
MPLVWKGDKFNAKFEKAMRVGLNKTMAEAVLYAKTHHEWKNRTGTLERSIRIVEGARKVGQGFAGIWGSVAVIYAAVHEFGASFRRGSGTVNIPARPFLVPAARKNYPNLTENIREAFASL